LTGELAHACGLIGAVHANVDPGKPHGLARAGHAGDVTELGQHREGDQLPDPELGHQCLAARLTTRDLAQRAFDLSDLTLERVDHVKRDGDALAGVSGQTQAGEKLPARGP